MKDYIETQYKNLDFTIPDDYVSRREVYAMLDYIGGADADEAFYQGWDAAIDEACSLLNDVDSAEILERYDGLFAELDEAREKAVPTAPENVEASTLMDGYVWWTCRACGNLQHTDKQVRYCADCGQRVKWEDAEG